MNLTELLSGSDVLTRMDYKKLANEPQRPLLYCPGEESWGQTGKLWRETSQAVPAHRDMVGVKLQLRSRLYLFHFLKHRIVFTWSGNVIGLGKDLVFIFMH